VPGQVGLAPWFLVLFWVLRLGLPLMLLVMNVDILRRPDSHFGRTIISSKWGWVAQNMVMLLTLLVALLGRTVGPVLVVVGLAFVPLSLLQGLRYLLRVVFPSPKRLAERHAAETHKEDVASAPPTTSPGR